MRYITILQHYGDMRYVSIRLKISFNHIGKSVSQHPGKVLDEYLNKKGLSQKDLERAIFVDYTGINGLIRGRRAITANTALRLAKFLGTTPEFWLELQMQYDLVRATQENAEVLQKIESWKG